MAEKRKTPLDFTAERITKACGMQISASDLDYHSYTEEKGSYWSALINPATESKHYTKIAVYWYEKDNEVISWSAYSVK